MTLQVYFVVDKREKVVRVGSQRCLSKRERQGEFHEDYRARKGRLLEDVNDMS